MEGWAELLSLWVITLNTAFGHDVTLHNAEKAEIGMPAFDNYYWTQHEAVA